MGRARRACGCRSIGRCCAYYALSAPSLLLLFIVQIAGASEPGPLAVCNRVEMCNREVCAMVCEKGTVVLDEWATSALRFQRQLALPRSFVFWSGQPGTHNGGQAQDWGLAIEEDFFSAVLGERIVIAEQRHTPFDQMRMGARNIELDLYYMPQLRTNTTMGVKVCHWPIPPADFCNHINRAAKEAGMDRDWDCARLGCDSQSPDWEEAMWDLRRFLDENPSEFVTIYIDNKAVLNAQVPEFVEVTKRIVGTDRILRPSSLVDQNDLSTWPTVSELLSSGIQVAFENNRGSWKGTLADEIAFTPPIWSGDRGGKQFNASSFEGNPQCTVDGVDFYGRGSSRWFDSSINLGVGFNGHPVWGGSSERTIEDSFLRALADCAINRIDKDQLGPHNMQHLVWSWEQDEPKQGDVLCASVDGVTSRWTSGDCHRQLNVACSSVSTIGATAMWVLGGPATFAEAERACPNGTSFELPRDGLQNSRLTELLGAEKAWVNWAPDNTLT